MAVWSAVEAKHSDFLEEESHVVQQSLRLFFLLVMDHIDGILIQSELYLLLWKKSSHPAVFGWLKIKSRMNFKTLTDFP